MPWHLLLAFFGLVGAFHSDQPPTPRLYRDLSVRGIESGRNGLPHFSSPHNSLWGSSFFINGFGEVHFPSKYHAKGNLELPYADLVEPFEFWFDEALNASRVDFYGGMSQNVVFVNQTLNSSFGSSYLITPTSLQKERICFLVERDQSVPLETLLPDLSLFEYQGEVILDGKRVNLTSLVTWQFERKNTYKFYFTKQPGSCYSTPVQFMMMGYDTLLQSHYDKYIVTYDEFDQTVNRTSFDVINISSCRNYPGPGPGSLAASPFSDLMRPSQPLSHDRARAQFQEYKQAYRRTYLNMSKEHNRREDQFVHNLRYIHSKNRAGLSYKLAVNHLADRLGYERRRSCRLASNERNSGLPFPKKGDRMLTSMDIPDEWDWRLYGAVTQVKDQATCGSCWTFGTTGTLEGAYFMKHDQIIRLSQQNLMDCSWAQGNFACQGGEDWRAYDWIMASGGIMSEEDYGMYLGQNSVCHFNKSQAALEIDHYYNVTSGDEQALIKALLTYGPISVSIDASQPSFSFYSHGVYYEPACKNGNDQLDHSVLLVGYGTLLGEDYWLIKNSWSTYWGNNGYVLMSRKGNNCGVATAATFVKLK